MILAQSCCSVKKIKKVTKSGFVISIPYYNRLLYQSWVFYFVVIDYPRNIVSYPKSLITEGFKMYSVMCAHVILT